MAEVNFYLNDIERIELFDFFKTNEVILIPDLEYSTPNYDVISDRNDFVDKIEGNTTHFFALSHHFSKYDLYLKKNKFIKDSNVYFIVPKYGGPYFEVSFYKGFADDAPIKYKCTCLSYYPRYIKLQQVYEEYKTIDKLKEFFKRIIIFLQSKCKRIKIDCKQYWVSKEVCIELGIK